MKPEPTPPEPLRIALPNGVIMSAIGFFLILTPFATPLEHHERLLDWVAGGILFASGLGSVVFGLRSRKRDALNRKP